MIPGVPHEVIRDALLLASSPIVKQKLDFGNEFIGTIGHLHDLSVLASSALYNLDEEHFLVS